LAHLPEHPDLSSPKPAVIGRVPESGSVVLEGAVEFTPLFRERSQVLPGNRKVRVDLCRPQESLPSLLQVSNVQPGNAFVVRNLGETRLTLPDFAEQLQRSLRVFGFLRAQQTEGGVECLIATPFIPDRI
jgi:hypothetical protein